MLPEQLREKVASWVIVTRKTGKAVFETFNPATADRVNLKLYEVVPIGDWLRRLNQKETP